MFTYRESEFILASNSYEGTRKVQKITKKIRAFIHTPPGVVISLLLVVSFIDAIRRAWSSHDFLPSFFLWWITEALYFPIILGPAAAAIFAGIKIAERTGKNWLGWVLGLAMLFIFGGVAIGIVGSIPGVGWRFHALMIISSSNDY